MTTIVIAVGIDKSMVWWSREAHCRLWAAPWQRYYNTTVLKKHIHIFTACEWVIRSTSHSLCYIFYMTIKHILYYASLIKYYIK